MKTFATVSALTALAAGAANAAMVNSPAQLITCQPAAITWSGATGTVYLSIVQGKDTSAAALETFPEQSGASGSYAWTVDQPAGTQLTFIINDSTGKPNYSSQVSVSAGSDTSCVGNNNAASSSSSASSSGSSSASSKSASSSTKASGSSSSASPSSSSSGSSSSSSTTSGAGVFASVNGAVLAAVGAGAAYLLA